MEPLPLGKPTASQTMTYPRRLLSRKVVYLQVKVFAVYLPITPGIAQVSVLVSVR